MPAILTTIAELEAIYGTPSTASIVKEAPALSKAYRGFIEVAPFVTVATVGPEGLDCSPRGDSGSAVTIIDDKTLHLADRRGNNRMDSLRNLIADPRISLMFLVPGSNTVLRVNGQAAISADPTLCARHAIDGHLPRTITIIKIDLAYFQCARALMRAGLWDTATWPDITHLATPGQMLAELTNNTVGGDAYDKAWPERAEKSMW